MKRVIVLGGAWCVVVMIAGIGLADPPTKQNPRPSYQPAPAGGFYRNVPPGNNGNNNNWNARRAAAAQAAAAQSSAAQSVAGQSAAARNALAAQAAKAQAATAATAARNAAQYQNQFGSYYPGSYNPYGYGYYPYSPNGTTPYALAYDPYTGASYLVPYGGGYYPSRYGYRYPYYGNPSLGYAYPGAVFVDPGQLYGIGPIQQLMGVGQWFNPRQNVAVNFNANAIAGGNFANPGLAANANPGGAGFAANAGAGLANPAANAIAGNIPAAPKPAAGGGKMDLAMKFVTFGDAQFSDLKYSDALERYRRAEREEPKLGDAWLREGFALAAMDKYDQAAKAIRRGLEENPDWADGSFRLDDIYGDNAVEKQASINRLLKAAEADQKNGDIALVAAVHLFSDGHADQAAPYFRRFAQIVGNDADVKPFLAKAQQP